MKSQLLPKIDTLIKEGKLEEAKVLLRQTKSQAVPADELHRFAALATRLGLPSLALRILSPVVRPTGRKKVAASALDKLQYASALTRIGATLEAREILASLNPTEVPDALLYAAFACFGSWDYAAAIPLLENYLKSPHLSDYQIRIARVNLAGALVDRRHPSAKAYVHQLLRELDQNHHRLLYLNTLIFEVERCIHCNENEEAKSALIKARSIPIGIERHETLYLDKWQAILNLKLHGKRALPELEKVREKARKLNEWETLRNCDYHQAVILKDADLFKKVYFGTPFESLRRDLIDDFHEPSKDLDHYDWSTHKGATNEVLELEQIQDGGFQGMGLKAGQLNHRVLRMLATDFYRPLRVAPLHAILFQGEYYNPESSPKRIHQLVKRARNSVKELPLSIEYIDDGYRLVVKKGIALRLRVTAQLSGRQDAWIARIQQQCPPGYAFSLQEVRRWTGTSHANSKRILMEAKQDGLLEMVGRGPSTRYLFVSAPLKKVA